MDHEYWVERLQGYIDNELSPADAQAMEHHIQNCPDCQRDRAYLKVMKCRLKAFETSVDLPENLQVRMTTMIARRKRLVRVRSWGLGVAVALAASAGLLFFLSRAPESEWQFKDAILTGQMTCHNCDIAKHAKMLPGSLCLTGHTLGLQCDNGHFYQIAGDLVGKDLVVDHSLHGKKVRIYGQVLNREHLLLVKNLERMEEQRASFEVPPSHSGR